MPAPRGSARPACRSIRTRTVVVPVDRSSARSRAAVAAVPLALQPSVSLASRASSGRLFRVGGGKPRGKTLLRRSATPGYCDRHASSRDHSMRLLLGRSFSCNSTTLLPQSLFLAQGQANKTAVRDVAVFRLALRLPRSSRRVDLPVPSQTSVG